MFNFPIPPGNEKYHRIRVPICIISENGCWEFLNIKSNVRGYPIYRRGNRNFLYSRFSLEFFKKEELGDGDYACHTCNNPKCVNPDHIYKGNESSNHQDMVNCGHSTRGERNPRSKLKEVDVLNIRKMFLDGVSCAVISKNYGVHIFSIHKIIRGVRWGWLK